MAAGSQTAPMSAGMPAQPLLTGPNSYEDAHRLALLQEMRKLPPAMQLQLLRQQQQAGGNGTGLSGIANQMSNPMAQQQPNYGAMPSGVNPNQD